MCGIGGILSLSGELTNSLDDISSMKRAIKHRGPDDEGVASPDRYRSFFNVRLSIVDRSGGHQPIYNEDDTIGIVYNGELYNYHSLRNELIAKGHIFRTETDTEVIVHLFEEEGVDSFARLEGMFAFAIWDREGTYLVRDKIGIKPLYVLRDGERLLFCSEVRGLSSAHPGLALSPEGIRDYFVFRYIRSPYTIYKNVTKLPPGHYLHVRDNRLDTVPYWDIPRKNQATETTRHSAELCEELRAVLSDSINSQLIGEVPIGLLLSGGMDSSAIAYFLHQKGVRLKTFNIGFASVNEFAYSRKIARAYGLEHYEYVFRRKEFVPYLHKYVQAIDEPIADAACIPLYKLAEEIKQHVTVVLSGEGSDELFGGYWQYEKIMKAHHKADDGAFQAFLKESGYFPENIELLIGKGSGEDRFFPYFTDNVDLLSGMQGYDIKTWLPDDLMMKADKILMAHSLEGRFPFLDSKLLSFASRLSSELKIGNQDTKRILRDAMRDVLPKEILARPKMGFTVPLKRILLDSKELVVDVMNSFSPLNSYVDHVRVVRLFNDYYSGRNTDHLRIWTLFVLYFWLNSNAAKELCH